MAGGLPTILRRAQATERIKLDWFMILLLVVAAPAFYILLWFKPYTWFARIGWGVWVGLILFVAFADLAEQPFDIRSTMEEAGFEEQDIPERVPLREYLGRLGGGPLGALIRNWEAEEGLITLWFGQNEDYFDAEQNLARIGIGAGFSLIYGRQFNTVLLYIPFQEQWVEMRIEQSAFNTFFGMSTEQMVDLGQRSDRFENSPLRNPTEQELQAFFRTFSTYRQSVPNAPDPENRRRLRRPDDPSPLEPVLE